jgi:predicted HTH domain antitoxin
MQISINLPDIKSLSGIDNLYMKRMLVANLYHIGKLSEKEAREILGKSRREFEELLPQFGFSILGDAEENIAIELNA